MQFLISTTQRCGSTWLTKALERVIGGRKNDYLNGSALGFKLNKLSDDGAFEKLREIIAERAEIPIFKTHDIPSKDFDRIGEEIPQLKILTLHREFKDVLISRYFYYRYHWPENPSLGHLTEPFATLFADVAALSDKDAISCVINSEILPIWVSEWKAFEHPFQTEMGIRLSYAEMIENGEIASLNEFIGRKIPLAANFEALQNLETATTGRDGRSRFYRQGKCHQWTAWISAADSATIDELLYPSE